MRRCTNHLSTSKRAEVKLLSRFTRNNCRTGILLSLPGKNPGALRCRHLQFVDTVPVFPNQGSKKSWRGIRLQNRQRLAGHAFARKSCRPRIASLRDPCPMPITARTVAAKEQLVFVPLEEIGSEGWIAGERVVAGVRR